MIKDCGINDLVDILAWRNDPLSCSMSINDKKIGTEEHEKWFQESLINPFKKMYIGENSDGKIGICLFDYDNLDNFSEVSINLNPKMRGKNLSYELLSNCIKIYIKNNSYKLKATIKKENLASLKIFKKCEFYPFGGDDNFYYLTK